MTDIEDLNGYENLILLCATDHALVDEHAEAWSADRLRDTKASHERWVASRLSEKRGSGAVARHLPNGLSEIRSGSRLMDLYRRSFSASVDRPERLDRRARTLVGTIFGTAEEWSDIWSDVSLSQQLDIEADLDDALDDLHTEGFMVIGGVRQMLVTVDGRDTPWLEALIFVRSHDEIQAMLDAEDSPSSCRRPDAVTLSALTISSDVRIPSPSASRRRLE